MPCCFSCVCLCLPMDCSPEGPSVPGIFQARMLEWVAISFFRGSSPPRDRTHLSYVSCIGRWVLYHWRHQMVKRLPTMRETQIQSLGREDLLEKGMANHSSILAPPGKSGLHASGEGERVIAPEPWEGTLASRRVEGGLSRAFPG